MASSEQSFADRHARAQSMHDEIAGFTPAFAPQDPNLTPSAFQSYVNAVEAQNDAVSEAESVLSPLTDSRLVAAAALKDKALRVKDFVGANVAWKKYLPAITKAADAVRGYVISKKATPPPAGTTPAPAKKARQGSRSQQGYADLEKLFGKLIAQVAKITGYTAPANSGLTKAELDTQDGTFTNLNDEVSTAESNLSEAQRIRKDYYDGENGLKEKMKCIKKAVRSQYGASSTQYAAVKGIAL
jgi:hypothetical protein